MWYAPGLDALGSVLGKPWPRANRCGVGAAGAYLEVQTAAGETAGGAEIADVLPRGHSVPDAHVDAVLLSVRSAPELRDPLRAAVHNALAAGPAAPPRQASVRDCP